MPTPTVKEEARLLIEKMPDNVTWDDLMHEIYVRQMIESGLNDSREGRVTDVLDLRKSYGLPE